MLEKSSKGLEMRAEASVMLRAVAEPKGNAKATIAAAAKHFKWSPRRTRAIWNKEARRIDGHEILALQAEYTRLRHTENAFMAALEQADPHRSREDISADLARIARLCREDRT